MTAEELTAVAFARQELIQAVPNLYARRREALQRVRNVLCILRGLELAGVLKPERTVTDPHFAGGRPATDKRRRT